jgi:hypothetical protein
MRVTGEAPRLLVERVLDVERDAPTIGGELRRLRGESSRELGVTLTLLFELLEAARASPAKSSSGVSAET